MEVNGAAESSPFVRIVDVLEADVFLIFKETIELGMMPMKSKFRQNKGHIGPNKRPIPWNNICIMGNDVHWLWRLPRPLPSWPTVLAQVSSHPV